MPIEPGMTATAKTLAGGGNLASAMGSGALDVFATPAMVALMEQAACLCLEGALEAGQTTVGTALVVAHTAATPPGMEVSATATVTAVDGRKVEFVVAARDEKEEIGRGTHTRFVVDAGRFMEKALSKG